MSIRRVIGAVSLLWLGSLMGAGFAFITQVLLARYLGPKGVGNFASAFATVSIMAQFAGFGIGQYWLKVFGEEGWGAFRWLKPSFRFITLSTIIITFIYFLWSYFGPHDVILRNVLLILSIHILGQICVELVSSKFQLEERYHSLAIWQLMPHMLRFVIVLGLIFVVSGDLGTTDVALVYSAVSLVFIGLGVFQLAKIKYAELQLKGHGERVCDEINKEPNTYTLVARSWPFGFAVLFHLIYFQSDIILVKYIVGSEEAGVYNVAFTIMSAVYILPTVIYQKFLMSKIHRWASHDRERFYEVYRKGNFIMLLLGIVAMLCIWLLSTILISWIFGDKYVDAIVMLNVLAVCSPIMFVAFSVGATLVTKENMRRKVKYMGVASIVNIVLNVALIPLYGAVGASIATVLSYALLLMMYYSYAEKNVFHCSFR